MEVDGPAASRIGPICAEQIWRFSPKTSRSGGAIPACFVILRSLALISIAQQARLCHYRHAHRLIMASHLLGRARQVSLMRPRGNMQQHATTRK